MIREGVWAKMSVMIASIISSKLFAKRDAPFIPAAWATIPFVAQVCHGYLAPVFDAVSAQGRSVTIHHKSSISGKCHAIGKDLVKVILCLFIQACHALYGNEFDVHRAATQTQHERQRANYGDSVKQSAKTGLSGCLVRQEIKQTEDAVAVHGGTPAVLSWLFVSITVAFWLFMLCVGFRLLLHYRIRVMQQNMER